MALKPSMDRWPLHWPTRARRFCACVRTLGGGALVVILATCTQPTNRDGLKPGVFVFSRPPSGDEPMPLSIELPDSDGVEIGDTVSAAVTAVGTPQSSDTIPRWTSSDSTVITVGPDGRLVGKGEGRAVVSAKYKGLIGQRIVSVGPTTFIGAGDIGVCQNQYVAATAAILNTTRGRIFTAGDNTYPIGAVSEWTDCWEPTWGRNKSRTFPTLGNHDVLADEGSAYFNYWGPRVGTPGNGYYSVSIGTWHIVLLNSETDVSATSAQVQWLAADLQAASTSFCTIAIWHRPRFSSSADEPSDPTMTALWRTLYAHGADIVINGHAHDYERFAPQTPTGVVDTVAGIRAFVVGTGGAQLFPIGVVVANSEVRQAATHGVIKFTLHAHSYDWQFVPIPGDPPFSDSGHGRCSR